MTSTGRCPHELLPEQCGYCRSRSVRLAPPERPKFGPWFHAGFDGTCDGPCGEDIIEGDLIRADGEGGWLCRDCGEEADDE